MDLQAFRQKNTALLLAVIILFALFGLWLRLLPMGQLTSGLIPQVIFTDSYYNMRLIEVITHNFPSYPWFDPMNGFPVGKDNDWGPLYPMFSAFIAILLGAGTRYEIMNVASWIPPVLSLTMVPLVYYTGKIVAGKKTGVIAACLISVIAGEYLYRSFFGYIDHHLEEVILSTAFILLYLLILQEIQPDNPQIPKRNPRFFLYSALAGLTYYLGMMNIPTIVLFAGIIGLFCGLHAIITRDERTMKSLTIAHGVAFGVFIILYGLTGIHNHGFSLAQYTPVHIVLALLLIAEPIFLAAIIHYTTGRPAWQTSGLILGIPAVLFVISSFLIPTLVRILRVGFSYFFFFSYKESFISEMQMWDLTRAFHSFNIALLVMIAGLFITGYQIHKKYDALKICILIWAFVILISTILHLRYEYYAGVVVVLFSAIALAWLFDLLSKNQADSPGSTGNARKNIPQKGKNLISCNIPLIVVGLIILIITVLSAQITWVVATEQLQIVSVDKDWADSLVWLGKNTPDPGIDPLRIYQKQGFSYQNSSYGVLSWWDYGHWITYVANRLPITSPFQDNVPPVAQFLLATDEKTADGLADRTRTRYIMLDYEMINSKYPSLPLWAFGQTARDNYQKYYFQQSKTNQNQYDPVLTLKPEFFKSMVSRLYIFDGTETNSTGGSLVQYGQMQTGDQQIPAISRITALSPAEAEKAAAEPLTPGTDIVSIQYTHPITNLPALTHYRLVYESPTVIASDEYAQMHSVKIFEKVPGYQIEGNGTIELPMISNQGRKFTYRQESASGTFTVPYATTGNDSGVRATGPYRNVQTGETYEVTEKQVQHEI